MRILCSISGLEFTAEHFPGEFYSREIHHPIFHLPQKRLLSYTSKWSAGELTRTDSYLLFLALLNSSDHIDWRVPVFRTERTDSIIANNMEYLIRTVIKLNAVQHPAAAFPRFAISPETKTLDNVHYWIETWEEAYSAFASGKGREYDDRKLIVRENALQRMIKNPHRSLRDYATQLAEWAAIAGSFPTFLIASPSTGLQIPCSEYWKSIIVKCSKDEYLYSIPRSDLAELLDHCEDNIPVGSIQSHALYKALHYARDKQINFLGLGDRDLSSSYQLLEDATDTESANMKALIDSAPLEEPRVEQYPSKYQYLRAKLRWDMAKKSGAR